MTLELLGAHEIRLLLNVSRQRAYQVTSKLSFPAPLADLEQGKVWDGAQVRAWLQEHRPLRQVS